MPDSGCEQHDGHVTGCRDCLLSWLNRPCPAKHEPEPPEPEPELGAPFDEQLPANFTGPDAGQPL